MKQRISIGEFLEQNEEFEFQVPEYFESKRLIGRLQERFRRFKSTFWSAGADEAQPWQKHRDAIVAAARDVPAYAGIDWQQAEYWRDIPLLSKQELRARAKDYVSRRYDKPQLWHRDTSGTSGPPLPIWYAPEYAFEFYLFAECKVAWVADAWTPEMMARPVLSAALVDKKSLSNLVWMCPDDSRGLTIRTVYDERSPGAPDALIELLAKHRPAILSLKPNILGSITSGADQRRDIAADYLELVISGGAILTDDVRRSAQQALGAAVYDVYGLTEIGSVASECKCQQGLHVFENDVIAEVLTADGSLQRTGSGELVLSSVSNDAMPLLRYRTGDVAELTRETCACGRPGLRIVNFVGRAIRNYLLADGSEFAPTNFNELFKRFPIREFQITQVDSRTLQALIEPFQPLASDAQRRSSSAGDPGLLEQVRQYMTRELRCLAEVEVSATTFSPGDKLQRFRSLI
jgi:phenylacetate-CoA ligase